MAKIIDWEKIFESFINAAEFEARLLFLGDEIYSVHFLKERVPSLEEEVYRQFKGVTEVGEYSLLNGVLYDETMNYERAYLNESRDNGTAMASETEKEYETFFNMQEEMEKVRLTDWADYQKSIESFFSATGVREDDGDEIKVLPREKKNELVKFYDAKEKGMSNEMRIEIVNEEKGEFDYDADVITEIVGQKLYEMMQKGAEGFYM